MSPLSLTPADIIQLAREIAARSTDDSLLDADDVAALLKVKVKNFQDNYSSVKSFPAPYRLVNASGQQGHRKWRRGDVIKWIDQHKDGNFPGRIGRPRNRPL